VQDVGLMAEQAILDLPVPHGPTLLELEAVA
jgi:hypothetical protein